MQHTHVAFNASVCFKGFRPGWPRPRSVCDIQHVVWLLLLGASSSPGVDSKQGLLCSAAAAWCGCTSRECGCGVLLKYCESVHYYVSTCFLPTEWCGCQGRPQGMQFMAAVQYLFCHELQPLDGWLHLVPQVDGCPFRTALNCCHDGARASRHHLQGC